MNVLTSDHILKWIAIKTVKLFKIMQKSYDETEWTESKGAVDVLDELRKYILTETNPHNREDIGEFKKKREKE